MAYNPVAGYYSNPGLFSSDPGLFSPIPVGMRVGPRYQPPEIPWAGYSPGGPTPESYKAAERAEFKNLADIESRYQNPNFYFGLPSSDQKALTSDYLGAMGQLSRSQRLDYYDFLQETSRQPSRFQENEPPVDIEKFPGLEYYINPDKFEFDKNNIWAGQPYQVASLGPTNLPTYEPAEIPGKKRSLAEIGKSLDAIERRDPAAIEALDRSRYGRAMEGALNWDPTISRPFNEQPFRERPRSPLEKLRDIENRLDAPSSKNAPVPVPGGGGVAPPLDLETQLEEGIVTQAQRGMLDPYTGTYGFPSTGGAAVDPYGNLTAAPEVIDAYYGGGIPGPSFVATGTQTAPDYTVREPGKHGYYPYDAQARYDEIAAAVAADEAPFSSLKDRLVGEITGRWNELPSLQDVKDRFALGPLTEADTRAAFGHLDPARYNINQYDPLGVKGAQDIETISPLNAALSAAGVPLNAPNLGGVGPLDAFMGLAGMGARQRFSDRVRSQYGLAPAPGQTGIGSFFSEAELADPSFAGYLGDVGAETGARSRPAPDYTGTTGYAPGDRAWDQYAYEYGKELENWNKEMAFATNIPEGPEKAELISYYSKLHPAHRLADIEKQAYFNSLDEGFVDLGPGARNALELARDDPTSGYRTADFDAPGGYAQEEINRAAIAAKAAQIEYAEEDEQAELMEYDPEAYEDNGEEQGLGYSADYGDWSGLGY